MLDTGKHTNVIRGLINAREDVYSVSCSIKRGCQCNDLCSPGVHINLSPWIAVCLSQLYMTFSLYIYTHTHTYIYIPPPPPPQFHAFAGSLAILQVTLPMPHHLFGSLWREICQPIRFLFSKREREVGRQTWRNFNCICQQDRKRAENVGTLTWYLVLHTLVYSWIYCDWKVHQKLYGNCTNINENNVFSWRFFSSFFVSHPSWLLTDEALFISQITSWCRHIFMFRKGPWTEYVRWVETLNF